MCWNVYLVGIEMFRRVASRQYTFFVSVEYVMRIFLLPVHCEDPIWDATSSLHNNIVNMAEYHVT